MESSIVNLAVIDAVRLSGIDFGKQKTIDTCVIGPVKNNSDVFDRFHYFLITVNFF